MPACDVRDEGAVVNSGMLGEGCLTPVIPGFGHVTLPPVCLFFNLEIVVIVPTLGG